MNRILILFIFFLVFNSCEKSNEKNPEIFIAGMSFGECLGDCNFFYKYEKGLLFADNCDFCNIPADIEFQSTAILEPAKQERMLELMNQIPSFLLTSEEKVFGCPDCGDWGAIHVIFKHGNEIQHFTLDNLLEGNPIELREFALSCRETIMFLNN